MLFKKHVLEGIEEGRISLAFRRWTKPTVRAGGSLRTAIGILAIESVEPFRQDDISREDARRAGFDTREALFAELDKGCGGTLYRVGFHLFGPDPREALRRQDQLSAEELATLQRRLASLDQRSQSGAWTAKAIHLIGGRDGRTAGEIAENLGIDKPTVKRRIRQLKELGLTESLQSGYRLSERGRAIYKRLPAIS
ncbi:helix-turn-helix domain-containing protein [Ochrobactrum soli]|uniref:MarR family transcriptional regulator n=1 Tax=Ochrobactrum soli TaxID=2448455 RepID=A0A849KXH7_9HYPH|nr:helix-turn-helix domain-containing protein [[Ochrobactrum] soli]NNU63368.1 MarR family transcriptional regulator [[Ochrobactrum] soli]